MKTLSATFVAVLTVVACTLALVFALAPDSASEESTRPEAEQDYLRYAAQTRLGLNDAELVAMGRDICTIAEGSATYDEFWTYMDGAPGPISQATEDAATNWEIAALMNLCPKAERRLDRDTDW